MNSEPREHPDPGGQSIAGAEASEERRVLLLDDDPAFNEVIRDFLAESGYTVVAVKSGVEGVREVLAGDFALILCDMEMPTMPGDMFYRAVERIRPRLCERFLFMTGYRGDARTNEFIKNVNGFVLRKPFHLKDLEDSIALIKVRRTFRSVFEGDETTRARAQVGPPAEPFLAKVVPFRAPPVAGILAPVPNSALARPRVPEQRSAKPSVESAPTAVETRSKQARAIFATLLVVALAAIPAVRYFDLHERAAFSSAELFACEQQWTIASGQLQAAEGKRPGVTAAVDGAKRIAAESKAPGLAMALQSIRTAVGANVELLGIEVRGEPDAPAAFHFRITGLCTGREPRATADRFRQALESNLKLRIAPERVTTRFGNLEEVTPSPSEPVDPRKRQAAFTVIATTGSQGIKFTEGSEQR